jgi:hypothetical protein
VARCRVDPAELTVAQSASNHRGLQSAAAGTASAARSLSMQLNSSRMRHMRNFKRKVQEGKAGWILLWLLGVPIPVLLVLFLLRGCT